MEDIMDISGKWVVEEEYFRNGNKNKKPRKLPPYEVIIKQKGKEIEMIMEREEDMPITIHGTLQGNTFRMKGTYHYPEEDRGYLGETTVKDLKIEFSDDGNFGRSTDISEWVNDEDSKDRETGVAEGLWKRIDKDIEQEKIYDFVFTLLFDNWQGQKKVTLKLIDWRLSAGR